MVLIHLSAYSGLTDGGPMTGVDHYLLSLDFVRAGAEVGGGGNRLILGIALRERPRPDGLPGFEMAFGSIVFGGGVAEFADSIGRVQTRRTGKAELVDWEGRELVCLSTSPERFPVIMVGGDWDVLIGGLLPIRPTESYVDWHDYGEGPRMGIFAVFQGLTLHADALGAIKSGLEEVLRDTGVQRSRDW